MPTTYIALGDQDADSRERIHLVREDAEASLCGRPPASLRSFDQFEGAVICRDCIDWLRGRWTQTMPKVGRK